MPEVRYNVPQQLIDELRGLLDHISDGSFSLLDTARVLASLVHRLHPPTSTLTVARPLTVDEFFAERSLTPVEKRACIEHLAFVRLRKTLELRDRYPDEQGPA